MSYKFKAGYCARKRDILANKSKVTTYRSWVGAICMNPDCESGLNIETHHINPVKNGGRNDYWNFISLCSKCHRRNNLHRDFETKKATLFTWKCFAELALFGFVLDENDDDYYDKIKQLVLKHKIEKEVA